MELDGKVVSTYLRGQLVYDNGKIIGPATGQYLKRPSPGPAS
jgi:allantoinase